MLTEVLAGTMAFAVLENDKRQLAVFFPHEYMYRLSGTRGIFPGVPGCRCAYVITDKVLERGYEAEKMRKDVREEEIAWLDRYMKVMDGPMSQRDFDFLRAQHELTGKVAWVITALHLLLDAGVHPHTLIRNTPLSSFCGARLGEALLHRPPEEETETTKTYSTLSALMDTPQ